MRVLIVSDTHGRHLNFDTALEDAGKVDAVIHLGDFEGEEYYYEAACECPLYMVKGNNDYFSYEPSERVIFLQDKTIFMTHGHQYMVSMDLERIKREARRREAQIVMHGHTHRPYVLEEDGMVFLNPGSLSRPRQAGREPSYIVMTIAENGKMDFDIRYIKD